MIFCGITKDFSLTDEQQYDTIGQFWDALSAIYGLENLQGLGYDWQEGKISYAIGLKNGRIPGCNFSMELPDSGWITAEGKTDLLKQLYDEIYQGGRLRYEIETFEENGNCCIQYIRLAP